MARPKLTDTKILDSPLDQSKPDDLKLEVATMPNAPEPKKSLYEKFDWLVFPAGMFDFRTAGVLFRNPTSQSNKQMIEQYRALEQAGYTIKLFSVDQGNVYICFEKA